MKKSQILAIAALAAAVTFQTAAKAEDPVSPVPGAVCNLYWLNLGNDYSKAKTFVEFTSALPGRPASATFVDSAGDFKDAKKMDGLDSNVGMWTGWLKQEKAGTYTFLCKRGDHYTGEYFYSVWVNEQKCLEAVEGQCSFNADLTAGFNSVRIIAWSANLSYGVKPISIVYKKAGGLKDPVPFGPGDMFHDDEED